MSAALPRGVPRYQAQAIAADWVLRAFGEAHARSLPQRAVRHAEESIELAQACGAEAAMLHGLIDAIYSRPVGEIRQEIGGVALTLLALGAAAGVDVEDCERAELNRVLSKPIEHFQARDEARNEAGFNADHKATWVLNGVLVLRALAGWFNQNRDYWEGPDGCSTPEMQMVERIISGINELANATPSHFHLRPLPAVPLTHPYGRPALKSSYLPELACPCACHRGIDVKHFFPCCISLVGN